MLEHAKRQRERLARVHAGQFAFFQINQQILPEMVKEVNALRSSLAVKDESLPQSKAALQAARKVLDKLDDQIRAIEEATELDRAAVAKLGAGFSQFLEEGELQKERMHEMAHLATLIQYFEVAAAGSVPFWVDLMGMVDNEPRANALMKLDRAKFKEWERAIDDAAINRVLTGKDTIDDE